MLSEHEPLNEFLGDAENPAHTKWLTTTQHFKGKYSKGNSILSYVQRSALNLARALGVIEDEILENLLDDIFGIPTDEDTKSTEKTASSKPGGKKPPREGVKSRSQYITRSKLKDGFRVYNLPDAKKTPDRVVIKMAYEAEGIANPFTQYHPADFNLNSADKKLVVQLDGCTELKRKPNLIEVSIDEPSFSVSIEGFDHKRDLKIDAKPYIDTEKEENEQ